VSALMRTTRSGGNSMSIPSAVAVALFAFFATRVVARYGFDRRAGSD